MLALLLIVLGLFPFTSPFSPCDLTNAPHDGTLHGGWKAPTDPDEALSLPEPADASHPLFTAVDLAECASADQLPTHRLIDAVLRL